MECFSTKNTHLNRQFYINPYIYTHHYPVSVELALSQRITNLLSVEIEPAQRILGNGVYKCMGLCKTGDLGGYFLC